MRRSSAALVIAAACSGLMLRGACGAERDAPAANDAAAPEEFIVTANALQDLRLQIKLAEDQVYARFNEINGDDSHDIHCYDRVSTGSHVPRRRCVSGLPFGAKRLVEVRVGEVAWNHTLTTHTFTIGSATGRIRDLHVRCGKLNRKLEYKEDVDWTLPDSWSECTLAVSAERGTTLALYEF